MDFTDRPRFELADQEDQTKKNYSAPNYSEWQRDRHKIVTAVDNILQSVKLMQRKTLSLPEAYYYNDPFN